MQVARGGPVMMGAKSKEAGHSTAANPDSNEGITVMEKYPEPTTFGGQILNEININEGNPDSNGCGCLMEMRNLLLEASTVTWLENIVNQMQPSGRKFGA